MIERPFSQACENNKGPILEVLRQYLGEPGQAIAPGQGAPRTVLEIGSGTGQHAVFFGRHLPHIQWQPSDVRENLPGIRAWLEDAPDNVSTPLELDVNGDWPPGPYDHIFTANTLHIMSRDTAALCLAEAAARLAADGLFLVYGPFNYSGAFTSPSNRDFDAWLRRRDPAAGIRDQEWVTEQLARGGLDLIADHDMPANNRLLVYRRREAQ